MSGDKTKSRSRSWSARIIGKRRHRIVILNGLLRKGKVGDLIAGGRRDDEETRLRPNGTQSPSYIAPNRPGYRRMDPLSVSASLVAVIGAAVTVAKQLDNLRKALRDASSALSSVTNEISDFRIVLGGCESALNELYSSTSDRNPATPLADVVQLFERATGLLNDLAKLAASCTKDSGEGDGRIRAVKFRWLKERSNVRSLQSQIREAKQDILALMESHSLYVISGMEVVVQQMSVDTGKFQSEAAEKLDHIVKALSAQVAPIESLVSSTSLLNAKLDSLSITDNSVTEPDVQPPPYQLREGNPAPAAAKGAMAQGNMIQIRASCYKRSCRPWCSCRCHVRRSVRSPELMKGFMGSLFLGYTGIPGIAEPCNETQCRRRSSTRLILSYQFPEWFWTRALFASFMQNTMLGPEMLLRVQNTIAFTSETYQFCLSGNVGALQRQLLDGKASPYDIDSRGISLLHNALKFTYLNQSEICRLLIACGADLYHEDHTGVSAFHYAWDAILLEPENTDQTKALLELFPVDEGGLDERQFSRIHKCVLGIIGSSLEDELEISTSAINDPDNMGRTPLYWAASRGDEKAVRLLLKYGATQQLGGRSGQKISPLHAAAQGGHAGTARQLLEDGAKVNDKRGEDDMTPLHYAVAKNDGNLCVKVLLEYGADVAAEDKGVRTPLLVATQNGMLGNALTLLENNAPIDHKCEDGWSVIAGCIFWNEHGSVLLLLEHGADYKIPTDEGDSVLHVAARYGDVEMLELLGDAGLEELDPQILNKAGKTAQEIADGRPDEPKWHEAFSEFIGRVGKAGKMKSEKTHDIFDGGRLGEKGRNPFIGTVVELTNDKGQWEEKDKNPFVGSIVEFSDDEDAVFEDALEGFV